MAGGYPTFRGVPPRVEPLAKIDDDGGFTNHAMFKIYEREEGHPHPAMREQMAIRPVEEPEPIA